jgi:elongation factor 1-gamma
MGKLYGQANNFRTKKVLVAAKFGKKTVELVGDEAPADVSPLGLTPAFVDGDVRIFGADAIALHLVAGVLGCPKSCGEVLQWVQWGEANLLPNALGYVLPSVSAAHVDKKVVELYKGEFFAQLAHLDKVLLNKTFLVGERLGLADISLALDLLPAFEHVLDAASRKEFVNVTRWFNTIVNQPQAKEVLGEVKLADKVAQFCDAEFKKNAAKVTKAAPAAKKEQPKKAEKKEEAKEELDASEEALAAEPKQKDPFESMPKTSFVFDAFKRVYSNEDTAKVAIPYFWDNFDAENCSIWRCDYKYNNELTLGFMSCNLIAGMFQRLEKLNKHAFASMILFGTDNNSQISGIWIWRGQQLAFELSPDWQVDYESYDWKKLDAKDEGVKKMVNEYLLWEGDFEGRKFNQGKIFK